MRGSIMVKFLHTADWHLGIKYKQLGDNAQKARNIRVKTIENLMEKAIELNVDFILISGDLLTATKSTASS